jgi:hypothetical protein
MTAGPEADHEPPSGPLRVTTWRAPLVGYGATLVAVLAVSALTIAHFERSVVNLFPFTGAGLLGALAHYDGGWYWLISHTGYDQHQPGIQSPVAFFPAYPYAMRGLGWLVGDNALAGILLTTGSGLGASLAFWGWCRSRLGAAAAGLSLLLLLFYPYGYYLYGVIYGDALFLFVTLLAFRAVERDQPLVAGLLGVAATLSRPVGIAVVLGLAVRTLERRGALRRPGRWGVPTRVDRSRVRPRDGLVLVSLSGLVGYMLYLWSRFGDPLLFQTVQHEWGHGRSPVTWLKLSFFWQVLNEGVTVYSATLVAQAVIAVGALAAVPLVAHRFGWGYGVYVLAVMAIPTLGTKDFLGVGRYALAAFPLFALAGEWASRLQPAAQRALLASSFGLLLTLMHFFSRGYYLS